jgi:hypothetical protein
MSGLCANSLHIPTHLLPGSRRRNSDSTASLSLRLMIVQAHPIGFKPIRIVHPQPLVVFCPTCGGRMRVVMRLWTSNRAFVDTGCE